MGHGHAAAERRYEQHRPESTPLYQLVSTHLLGFLAEAREHYERGLPRYVERELRSYLECGIHAQGGAGHVGR